MAREIGCKQGLVWGAALAAFGLIYRLADISPYSPLKWVFYLLLAAGCIVAQVVYVRRMSGLDSARASFGGKLATGSLVALIGSAIYAAYVFVHNRFIDDSLIRTVVADSRRSLEASGAGGQSLALVEWMASPANFALLIFVQLLVVGAIATLLGAFVVHNRGSNPLNSVSSSPEVA